MSATSFSRIFESPSAHCSHSLLQLNADCVAWMGLIPRLFLPIDSQAGGLQAGFEVKKEKKKQLWEKILGWWHSDLSKMEEKNPSFFKVMELIFLQNECIPVKVLCFRYYMKHVWRAFSVKGCHSRLKLIRHQQIFTCQELRPRRRWIILSSTPTSPTSILEWPLWSKPSLISET